MGQKQAKYVCKYITFTIPGHWSFSLELLSVLVTGGWRGGKIAGQQKPGIFYGTLSLLYNTGFQQ